jgi:hypothetical protein
VPGRSSRWIFPAPPVQCLSGLPIGWKSGIFDRKSDSQTPRSGHESANRTVIYDIDAKPFFEAIGEQDNRNRRWRQPYSIKIKHTGVDYVLAHRVHEYLATETEKLDYFSGTLGIDRSYLPGRVYRSKDGRTKTARYFVDKFPLFLSGAPSAAHAVVCFC